MTINFLGRWQLVVDFKVYDAMTKLPGSASLQFPVLVTLVVILQ